MKAKPRINRPIPQPKLDVTEPANSEVSIRQMTAEERERLGEPVASKPPVRWKWTGSKGRERNET